MFFIKLKRLGVEEIHKKGESHTKILFFITFCLTHFELGEIHTKISKHKNFGI